MISFDPEQHFNVSFKVSAMFSNTCSYIIHSFCACISNIFSLFYPFFSDVRTFEGSMTIINIDFNANLLVLDSLSWFQFSLSIEAEVGFEIASPPIFHAG